MKLSAFQKVVYCLSFFSLLLSALTSTAMLPFQNLRSVLSYVFLIADFAIIILIKVFFITTEKRISGHRLYYLFRENNLFKHQNYLYTVTEEINIFCVFVSMLLTLSAFFFVVIYGHLSECIGALLLSYLIIFRCKYYLYHRVIGKTYDSVGNVSNSRVVRGFAKLFLGEYKATDFRRRDSVYNQCLRYHFDRKEKKQHECIKRILWFDVRIKWHHEVKKAVLSLLILILITAVIFHPKIDERIAFYLDYFSVSYFTVSQCQSFLLFLMNLIFCFSIISILLGYQSICQYIVRVLNSVKNNYRKRCFDMFNEIQIHRLSRTLPITYSKNSLYRKITKAHFKKIFSLGLTSYCIDYALVAKPFDVSDLRYHPLFRFQMRIPVRSFLMFMAVLSFSLFLLMSERIEVIPLFIILGSVWIVFALLCFWLLPVIRKKLVKHYCKKLEQHEI